MAFLKNKLVIIIIIAILAGGVTGLYLSKMNMQKAPDYTVSTGSGTDPAKVGEVMQKLNDLTKD